MRQESGTEAERLAYNTTGLPVLSTWEVTSGSGQGNKYTWGGSAWVQTRSGGAALVSIDESVAHDPDNNALTIQAHGEYEIVAANQSNQIMGTTGAVGDYLRNIIAVGTAAGQSITIIDDSTTLIALDIGDETKEFNLGWHSKNGAWKITTSASVSLVAAGSFT